MVKRWQRVVLDLPRIYLRLREEESMMILTLGQRALIRRIGESVPDRALMDKSIEICEDSKSCVEVSGGPGPLGYGISC
jgi:hypothetical protein